MTYIIYNEKQDPILIGKKSVNEPRLKKEKHSELSSQKITPCKFYHTGTNIQYMDIFGKHQI